VNERLIHLAASVIERASSRLPADAVLRGTLKGERGLMRREGGLVSRAVFSYYRWWRWLEEEEPIGRRLRQAIEFAERFAVGEETFSTVELSNRAIPAWTHRVVEEIPVEWLRSIQREPRLWLRARRGTAALLASRLGGRRAAPNRETKWDESSVDLFSGEGRDNGPSPTPEQPNREPQLTDALQYTGEEDLFRTPEFQAGQFELQDIASQAVGLLCAPQPGETWWDACAGEGGKTLHLSDLMENRGLIWATDRADWRLKRLRLRAARAECFNHRTAIWDGGARLPFRTKFDGVLVDAPCSSIGTWGRNPHARWTVTADDAHELAAIQTDLLGNVAPAVKAAGRLVYSVCSLSRPETEDVVTGFEHHFKDFEPLSLTNPFRPWEGAQPRLWLWPQDTGGNGMFVAAWRRKA
jgi:16S rRNA (cytosine967-C5)-methyltransferase